MSNYPFDPLKPIVNLADARLQQIFVLENYKFATLFEYSKATGIPSDKLFSLIQPYLESQDMDIDALGGELFLNTNPEINNYSTFQIPPNLWELLRKKAPIENAFNLWSLIRDLESAGWVIDADPLKAPIDINGVKVLISLKLRTTNFPILILPLMSELGNPAGPLTKYLNTNNKLIAIVVKNDQVEQASTMVRKWILSRPHRADVTILILPEPRYQPIIISSKDLSLSPVTVTKEFLEDL
jgi:hypothetical protein